MDMLMEMPFTLGQCPSVCTVTRVMCQHRWTALVPAFFPYLRVEFSPAVNQNSFYDGEFCLRDCAQLMDGRSKGCSFEGRHQRAVKALWEGA